MEPPKNPFKKIKLSMDKSINNGFKNCDIGKIPVLTYESTLASCNNISVAFINKNKNISTTSK